MKSLCTKYGKRGLSMLLILAMVFSLGFLNTTAKAISIDDVKSSVETALLLSELFSGSGTAESPYLIADEQDLIELQLVSNGTGDSVLQSAYAHGTGMYFKLTADISLTADWVSIANGSDYYFAGSFNGDGHTISDLNMTAEAAAGETVYGGLFGYTDGATISNLTVTGSVSVSLTADEENTNSSAIYAGGIVGCAVDTTVSDCAVNVTVKAANAATGTVNVGVGGAVGYLGVSSAEASASVANVSAQSGTYVSATTSAHGDAILTLAGGVVGLAHGSDVSGCTSAASVVVNGSKTLYQTGTYTTYGQFYNSQADGTSTNEGTGYYNLNEYHYSNTAGGVVGAAVSVYTLVTSSSGAGAGATTGITYTLDKETTVTDCTSTAIVVNETGSNLSFAGGVVGTSQFATVSGCSLSSGGQVSGAYAGGVFGVIAGDNTVSDCTASGTVTGTASAGGIAGQLGGHVFSRSGNQGSDSATFADSVLTNCTASGTVTCSDGYAGGIVGYMTYADSISGSSNAATVTGSNAGGILGGVLNSYSSSGGAYANGSINYNVSLSNNAVTDCNNTGAVSGSVSAGGVAGYVANPCTTISDCSNSGTVSGTGTYAGGVVAYYYGVPDYSDFLVRNVSNSANVTGSATYAGGVIGYLDGNVTNVSYGAIVLTNAYNSGVVTGGNYVGGVVGYIVYGMSNCYNSGTVNGTIAGAVACSASTAYTELANCYALSGTASALIGSGKLASSENLSFFNADQKLTEDTDGYETLLVVLNTYVGENSTDDVPLSYWQSVSGGYPAFTDDFTDFAATTPATPTVTYTLGESSGTDASVSYTAGSSDTLVLATSNVTCGDGETILYQWYSSTSDSVSTATKIADATGTTYEPDTSASGTTYYWVSAAIQNSYIRTTEVFSATFTVAVSFNETNGVIDGGTFQISLKDTSATNSETNPYIIDTATKLLALPAFLSDKTTAYYFEQTEDIDLESAGWTPIGSSKNYAFQGIYDGGGYTVKGLYINAAPTGTAYYGMFGYVNGGTVKNLTVSGEVTITTAKGYIGGLVGYAAAGSTIDNCATEDMTINGGLYTGGIVGYALTTTQITDCVNNADVSNSATKAGYVGGVAGYSTISSSGSISNIINNGSVTSYNLAYVGGLIGGQAGTAAIENAVNTGMITSADNTVGGLIGSLSAAGKITNGVNTGTVYGESVAGGLVGSNSKGAATILNCANAGAVSGGTYAGGLVGSISIATGVWNSSNTGEITGGEYVGGLAGYVSAAAYFRNSYNVGTVTGEFISSEDGTVSDAAYVGGLVGYMKGHTYNCYNSAAVTGGSEAQVGALLGYLSASRTISSSYYLAQDNMNPIAETEDGSTVEYLGSFDTDGTLTAADVESGLAYTGDLLNHLNAWVVENINTYSDALAWVAQDDGYPVLDFDEDSLVLTALKAAVPATVTVEMSSENLSKVAYQGTAVFSATVTIGDDGLIGSVTYQWLMDGEEIADATGTLDASDEAKTFTLTLPVDTSASGEHVYTLQVANTNTVYNVAQIDSADAEITVAKDTNLVDWGGTWDIADGFASGDGTAENPYIISNANELAYLAQAINDGTISSAYYYKLAADLNLNGYGWTPIGKSTSTAFQGNFDGNGYTISGLYATGSSYVGLFGITSNANIDNLTLSGDVTSTGAYAVGMLIGRAYGDTAVSNVVVSGTVANTYSSSLNTTYSGIGGLVGAANSVLTLTNCGNEATVTSARIYPGGLIGLLSSSYTVSISGCYNAGDVTNNHSGATVYAGGLVGYVYSAPGLKLENSYNIGSVVAKNPAGLIANRTSTEASVGGATFENCYNAGTISSSSNSDDAYSLFGSSFDGTYETISNCYYLNATATSGDQSSELSGVTGVDVLTADNLGNAFSEATTVGTVTFVTEHTSVTTNGGTEATTTASASPYPYLSWQNGPLDSSGYVSFRVAIDEGYTLADVSAATGEIVPYNAETYAYVAVVTGDDTVTITDVVPATLTVTGENATLTFASGYAEEAEETEEGIVYTIGQTTTVTFTVEADDNYAVTSVVAKISAADEGTALEADADGIYSLTLGTEDATVVITTAPTYQVTLTFENTAEPVFTSGNTKMDYTTGFSSGAWVIVDYCLTVIDGTTVTFTVEPDSEYALALDSVLLGENALLADENGVYSFAVSSDVSGQTLAITGAAAKVSVDDDNELIYTGQAITPNVTVTVGGNTVESSYYSVAYNNNIDVGTASVTATLQNGYIGTATGTFSIGQKELTKDDFTVPETADYNYGAAVEVEIVSDLKPDVDYTVRYANNIDAGTDATLIIYGKGNYTGTLTYEYAIVAAELSSDAVTIEVTGELSYTGEDVKPAVAVSLNGVSMTEGTDYELDYASATEEGNLVDAGNTGIVTVTFQGNYSGTATATYTIAKAEQTLTVNHDTQELPVSASKDLSTLNLVSGNQTELIYGLAEGDDFTLNGSVLTTPETEKAEATITIYAAEGDNYNASEPVAVTVTTVNKADVSESITFESGTATYTGEALTYEAASVEVEETETDGTWTYVYYDANGTKLDSAPTDAGTYTVTATYTSGDSTGTASTNFTIEPQPVEATVALSDSSAVYTYTGNAIEPDVEITVDGAALTEDTVYTYEISYADEVNAGTASATVTFTGNYSGEASTTFTIEARTLTAEDFALESDSVVYNGSEQTPAVILANGLNLAEGTDYSVAYSDNENVGTATITITGLEPNCTGSAELTFEITGSDVSENVTVTVADGSYVYTGEAIEADVTVEMNGVALERDTDYTVAYANNVNAGTATVTVTLTGNYSGTVLTESFTIEKAEQTLVMRNDGTIIAEIGETLDLTTLIEDSSSYAGTLLFDYKSGSVNLIGTGNTVLNIISELEAGTELELTVYALGTTNYNASETVTFTVTAVARTSITIDSDNADVVVYERTTETDEDGEVQTVDTLLSADAETGAYSAKQGMTISFTVTPESGYGLPNVTVNGETVEPDENGYYVVELTAELLAEDSDLVISVSVKRTSWDESSGDTADADIESIIASVAAGTQAEDADGSTYEDSLDYNDDGKNDLLDILNILYRTEEQDTDSTDETVEEAASEDATEDATETSDGASEDASDEDSDESSDEAAAGSDSEAADDSGADTGADSEAASGDAAE